MDGGIAGGVAQWPGCTWDRHVSSETAGMDRVGFHPVAETCDAKFVTRP
jgi:hypothetical protein